MLYNIFYYKIFLNTYESKNQEFSMFIKFCVVVKIETILKFINIVENLTNIL